MVIQILSLDCEHVVDNSILYIYVYRSYARGDDVILEESHIDYVVKTAQSISDGELGAHNTYLRDRSASRINRAQG